MSKGLSCQIVDVNSLPTLPAIAIEAIRLMEGERSNFHSIAELLKNDQVLASRILHYANAAYIGAQRKITSISRAISLLGFNTVRSTILSVSIFDCFSGQLAKKKQKSLVNFWLHSVGVAATARILAEKLGFPEPEEAYIAGLIHDLGKLVIYLEKPDKFQQVCDAIDEQGSYSKLDTLPIDLEKIILDTDHVETGKALAEWWGFPEDIGRVMWLHHQPSYETIMPEEKELPKLIRFADVLCVTHNVGSSYFMSSGNYCHEHFHFALENLALHNGLTPTDIDEIMENVHERVKEVADLLGIWDEKIYRKQVSSANISLGTLSINLDKSNKQLTQMSKVLNAACDMTRQLSYPQSLTEAAKIVATAANNAFGVTRSLCTIRDDEAKMFVGQLYEYNTFHEIQLPMQLEAIQEIQASGLTDIEMEALHHLERTTLEISNGGIVEQGLTNFLIGSGFMATFFTATPSSPLSKHPILGELVVDFSSMEEFRKDDFASLRKQFEALSLAAGSALEKILLAKGLALQTQQMAEASRKMEESQRQLFHSHRLATVGRLAAGAAHEINNPLTVISLNVQVLEQLIEDLDCDPQILQRITKIADQGERISKIIQDLMGFAHPAQPDFCQSSVHQIMLKVLSVLEDRVAMDKIKVENLIPKDLPPVMVDPLQIEQVFMNLMVNANHAMPDGGKIILSGSVHNGFIETRVTDTGQGISKENLGKIFDPFFTTKKEGEGSGLGLAICHSIVEHNGGIMKVDSNVGAGTTFSVFLPTDKSDRLREMKKAIEEQKKTALTRSKAGKYRLLVIDDERAINDTLQDSLRQAGYEVDGAYDGVEGLGLLRYKDYDLVLLDIRMPRKDGIEVLEFIREEYPHIQIIIITGLASLEEIQETVKMGAFACMKKPFRLEEVLDRVAKALQKKKPKAKK